MAANNNDDVVRAIADLSLDNQRIWERLIAPVRYLTQSITRPADTTAYTANDAFADSASAPTVGGFRFLNPPPAVPPANGSVDVASGGFVITDGIFVASAATAYSGEIWLFDTTATQGTTATAITAINDNAAFDVSDAQQLMLVGIIPFQTVDTTSSNAVSYVTDIGLPFACRPSDLRFLVKVMNAPTPASAEVLSIRLKYYPMRPI